MRAFLSLSSLAFALACAGFGDDGGPASMSGDAAAPTASTPPLGPLAIAPFAPGLGERFAVTTDTDIDLVMTGGAEPVLMRFTQHTEGELTIRQVTNGQVTELLVRVTAGKDTSQTPQGTEENLPLAVGREYIVTRASDGKHLVWELDRSDVGHEEAERARTLASNLFSKRTAPLSAAVGQSIDPNLLFSAPRGLAWSGALALQAADASCAAPFTGNVSADEPQASSKLTMSGDLCVEPATGLVTSLSFRGEGTGTGVFAGTGTLRLAATTRRL